MISVGPRSRTRAAIATIRAARVVAARSTETAPMGIEREPVSVEGLGVEAEADWSTLRSPETYPGHARSERRASPDSLRPNEWGHAGEWTTGAENLLLERSFLPVRNLDSRVLAQQPKQLQLLRVFLFSEQVDLQVQLIALFAKLRLPVLTHQDQRRGKSGFK